jgi:FkbH-like protein
MEDSLQIFLAASERDRPVAFAMVAARLREALDAARYDEAAALLRRAVFPSIDYTSAQALVRLRQKLRGQTASNHKIKLAVLGSFTTKQLVALIDLHLFAMGVEAEIYEGEYGVFRQEILDPTSEFYQFAPKILFLATTWRDLGRRPGFDSDQAAVCSTIQAEQGDWSALWQTAHHHLGCQIIQNNFTIPPWRSFGNHEARHPGSFGKYLTAMNLAVTEAAPPFVTIHDVDHLASTWGRWRWDDLRFFHQAKMPCDPECLVDYSHSVASIIAAQLGLAKKCLVLDLDNTLWGGVIGDDGLGGIRLGQGNPEGEAYLEFQKYVKNLRQRGVLLAVCSKNREETALEVFDKHPEMALRREDISCFVANWEDKATNLRTIAKTLNIGLDSLVFADDNPAERAIARQLVPEVAVPELPEDVTGYVKTLEQHRYFQVLSIGAEDLRRTEYYRSDAMRRDTQASAGDLQTFLQSLEMIARIGPITAVTMERSVQLIQRSNQFNLTTRRRSIAELSALLADKRWISRTVSLADRFGDNGLISVLLAQIREHSLEIDTWLMSCRVLKRGVEAFLLNHLCQVARDHGLNVIRGEYIPTSKNELVRNHYAELGFSKIDDGSEEHTAWELKLADCWRPLPNFIKEETNGGANTK